MSDDDPLAEVMAEFQAEFLATMPARLKELRDALAHAPHDDDARVTVRRVAHRLAGTAPTVGLDDIGRLGRAIEDFAARCAWGARDLALLHAGAELLESLGRRPSRAPPLEHDPRYLALVAAGAPS